MPKDCLYVVVLLVVLINYVKTEASNDLDPLGSLDHENMEFDDSLIQNGSKIELSFNDGTHLADDCKCDKGKCVPINGKLTCTCPPEFGVYIFKNIVECRACDCGRGVNCTFDPDFFSYGKKCVCPFGFKYIISGKKCEDPCTNNPCKNGGTCKVEGEKFKCVCKVPYAGNTCESDVCTENPCNNEGVCTIEGDSFKCTCKPPYMGNTCEKDVCMENPCKYEGVCELEGNSFKCNCKPPYMGKTCEEVSDVCTVNPCKNDGVCTIEGDSFKCKCKPPYIGKTCEEEIDTTEADTTIRDRITTGPVTTTNKTEFNTTDSEFTSTDHFSGEITTNTYECHCGENSVSCRIDRRGNKLCFCKDGFDQRRGTDICSRTCQSNADCRNDGICDRDGPGYFCLCPEPFIGDRCELDVCNSVRFECRSRGAECVRQGSIGVCECPRGKKMSLFNYCEDVCTYETCVHGTCELTDYNFSQYVCNCYEGYYGSRCENALVMQYTPAITIIVILASGIVLFSITSMVAGCWVKRLRKKIAEYTKQTGQP